MSVLVRSNDLWYGFANDQYCFSKLQQMIAKELNIETGWYYHFTNNMHLYFNFLNKKQ
jgi:thymidylate synthase